MDKDQQEDAALDSLFTAARTEAPKPSDDFLARLNADALAAMPKPLPTQVTPQAPSIFDRFKALVAVSGLSGAAALGVWIGFVMPDVVTNVSPFAPQDTSGFSIWQAGPDLSQLSE